MNVKSMVFVGFILVGVILLMGLKDEINPKWEYGQLRVIANSHGWSGCAHVQWRTNEDHFSFRYESEAFGVKSLSELPRPSDGEPSPREKYRNDKNLKSLRHFLWRLDRINSDDVLEPITVHDSSNGVVFLMDILGSKGWELVDNVYREYSGWKEGHESYLTTELIYTYTFKRRIQ